MLYLDYAASSLPNKHILNLIHQHLSNNTYGNPHSDPNTEKIIESVRHKILTFIGLNPNDYSLIFTSGATDSLKFIGYNIPIKSFSYTKSNHNSVTGLRGLIKSKIRVLNDDFEEIKSWGSEGEEGINLVAFPAESNFSGKLFPLSKVKELQTDDTFVLLDCAKYITCRQLTDVTPDFIPISFYKLFGYPTGLGALIIHNRASSVIKKKYYGGGTYSVMIPESNIQKTRTFPYSLEDGTNNFLSIISLNVILENTLNFYNNNAIQVTKYAYTLLKRLRHYNNVPLLELYNANQDKHGSILAFNLKDHNNDYIGFKDVEKLCDAFNIKLRVGCFCNPGECNTVLNLNTDNVLNNFKKGNKCWDMKDIIDGKPTGAIRISFGRDSNYEDVERFYDFLEENYIISDNNITTTTMSINDKPRITELYIYPIKGAKGFRVNDWEINNKGLLHDREFTVYDSKDKSVSLKSNMRLGLIRPEIRDDLLTLINEENNDSISVSIKRFELCKETVNDWISIVLKEEGCKLVKCGEDKNFSNTSQFLLLNKSSLYDLNYRILSNTRWFQWVPSYLKKVVCDNYLNLGFGITTERFRPNIVIEGLTPYQEDTLEQFKQNNTIFNKDDLCSRCYTTTIDVNKQRQDIEPMRTLLKYRKIDGRVIFGCLFNTSNESKCEGNKLKEGEIQV